MNGHVLVAAPTWKGKDYALDRYLAAFRALDYPAPRSLLLVDNTDDGGAYADSIRPLLHEGEYVTHIEPSAGFWATFHRSWQVIEAQATDMNITRVLSLEADVIVSPEALRSLVVIADLLDACVVSHAYPPRDCPEYRYTRGLGCVLTATEWLTHVLRVTEGQMERPDFAPKEHGGIEEVMYLSPSLVCIDDRFAIDHLSDASDHWPYAGRDPRSLTLAEQDALPTLRG